MHNVRQEVRELIRIHEKIQSALLHGDRITDDEATLIRQCASELLEKIPPPSRAWAKVRQTDDGGQTVSDGKGAVNA